MQYLKLPTDELKDLFSDNDKETMYLYTFLNFNAVYKEQTIKIKSKTINLKIGQFAISERLLGKILKIEKSKIRRIILSLKEKGIIETITSDSCTIFSINSKVIRTTTPSTKSMTYNSCRTSYEPVYNKEDEPVSEPLLDEQNQQLINTVEPLTEPVNKQESEPSDSFNSFKKIDSNTNKKIARLIKRKNYNDNDDVNNTKDLVIGGNEQVETDLTASLSSLESSISKKDDLKDKVISFKQSQERILKKEGFSSIIDFDWVSDLRQKRSSTNN